MSFGEFVLRLTLAFFIGLVFWLVFCAALVLLFEWLEPDEPSPHSEGTGPVNDYLKKIAKVLDQAADELDGDEFDELLDHVGDELDERRDGSDSSVLEDEDD